MEKRDFRERERERERDRERQIDRETETERQRQRQREDHAGKRDYNDTANDMTMLTLQDRGKVILQDTAARWEDVSRDSPGPRDLWRCPCCWPRAPRS